MCARALHGLTLGYIVQPLLFLYWCLFPVPPITFKKKLINQEVEEESTISLQCELSRAGISVQWKKGEEVLKPGLKYQIRQQDTTMELIIKKAMPEDSGVYSCLCGDLKTKAIVKVFGRTINA